MFKNNRNLIIIALIAVVNALGYGIIIPILYSYSQRFGLSDFANGLLFAVYSLCQFISTPMIGRLSDKYGRKPLLIISIAGTALSFFLMAFAKSGVVLFLARALDGITAGNIPVASAVISDTTTPKDRAKGFGIIGAAFGFGFVFGPALSAATLSINPELPFIIAGVVSLLAVVLTWIFLPETNQSKGQIKKGKLFDFRHLVTAVTDEAVGETLLISLIYSFAFAILIYAYQPFSVKMLGMNAQQLSIVFTLMGIVGVIAQGFIIPRVVKRFGERQSLIGSLLGTVVTFIGFFILRSVVLFIIIAVINSLFNSFVAPLVQALLSKEMDAASQGSILGLNASYISLGNIVGPVVGGIVASFAGPATPFLLGAVFLAFCAYLGLKILRKHLSVQHAF